MPEHTSTNIESRLPKIIGSDTELGNVIIGKTTLRRGTGSHAAWALLNAIDGVPSQHNVYSGPASGPCGNPQDMGRKYLRENGGCCYIDLDHFEICTPETTSARDYTAAWQGMLRLSQRALANANQDMPEGNRIHATVNNSDGNGSSWGGHLSFLLNPALFRQLCVTPAKLPLGYLMSFQASSIVYAGAGKVGAENGKAHVPFQISQRADFFSSLLGPQTTHDRPLVNTRNEALCGTGNGSKHGMSRLHVIFYDSNLAPVATYLKAGVLQIVLAMLEDRCINPLRHLVDPLRALWAWSHDPDLNTRASLCVGQRVTAVEHQLMILEDAKAFVASGEAERYVPHARHILDLWEDTLLKLNKRDWSGLAGRLDWVAKRTIIDSAVTRNGISWDSAEAKHLDLLFADLDPATGLHWALARDGVIEHVNTEQEIEHFTSNPPDDTRAWSRAMLLRRAEDDSIEHVNWDRIRVRHHNCSSRPFSSTLALGDPLQHTKESSEAIFSAVHDLPDLIEALGGNDGDWASGQTSWPANESTRH